MMNLKLMDNHKKKTKKGIMGWFCTEAQLMRGSVWTDLWWELITFLPALNRWCLWSMAEGIWSPLFTSKRFSFSNMTWWWAHPITAGNKTPLECVRKEVNKLVLFMFSTKYGRGLRRICRSVFFCSLWFFALRRIEPHMRQQAAALSGSFPPDLHRLKQTTEHSECQPI